MMHKKNTIILSLLLLFLLFFESNTCYGLNFFKKETKEPTVEIENPVQEYQLAMYRYAKGKIDQSLKDFEDFERKYPTFSEINKVIIMQAYLFYLKKEYQSAIQTIDRFLEQKTKNEYTVYAEYLKTISSYRLITGLTKSYEKILQSKKDLDTFCKKYPNNKYYDKTMELNEYLDLVLIYYEINIGETYQKERNYFAAINRYNFALTAKKTDFLPICYYRLYECYASLGLEEEAGVMKEKFDESIKNLKGDIPFVIEGIINYDGSEKTKQSRIKKAQDKIEAKKLKRLAEKQDKYLLRQEKLKTQKLRKEIKAKKAQTKKQKVVNI